MKNIIHKILEGKYQADKNLSPEDQELDKIIFNKIKTIYNSCMDEDEINKKGKEPLINLLKWFNLFNNKSKYECVDGLTNLIVDLHYYGVDIIFKKSKLLMKILLIMEVLIDPLKHGNFQIKIPKSLMNVINFFQVFQISLLNNYSILLLVNLSVKYTTEIADIINERDIHSPGKYRVNGSVSNNEHFTKTFNCPKNSPMNPNKKCLIW